MDRVYCSNCEYYSELIEHCYYEYVNHYNKLVITKGYLTDNNEGTCPNYKRIWYKFWIK